MKTSKSFNDTRDAVPIEENLVRLLKFGTAKKIRDLIVRNPGINLHYPTQRLTTPLTTAVEREDPQILANLLEKVPTILDDTTTQACGKTALMHASYVTRNTDVLQVLLKKGADPLKIDVRGWSCIQYAVIGERIKNVTFLLDFGVPVDTRDLEGRTPLMISVFLSNLDVLSLLLDRGANIDARDNAGFTALQLAILRKKREAALALLERGSDVDHVSPVSKCSIYELAERLMPNLLSIVQENKKIDQRIDDLG